MNMELKHHGIKGQKWGVRRFQNKDGSLTQAGKKRKVSYKDAQKNYQEAVNREKEAVKKYEANKSKRLSDKRYNEIVAERNKAISDRMEAYRILEKIERKYNTIGSLAFLSTLVIVAVGKEFVKYKF